MPAAVRPALDALWRLDATLGAVLATGKEPMVSRIRLAWWREALERLDREPPPAEPLLQDLAAHVLSRAVTGAELAAMEEGWAELLADGPLSEAALRSYAEARGRLFALSARLLGGEDVAVEPEGRRWALVDLARRSSEPAEGRAAIEQAGSIASDVRLRGRLVPIGILDALVKRDIRRGIDNWERQGSPSRMTKMATFRLFGI